MPDDHYEDAVKAGIKKLYALKKEYEEAGGGFTITTNTSQKTMSFINTNPEDVSLRGSFLVYEKELLNEVQTQMRNNEELLLVGNTKTDEMNVYTVHLPEEEEKDGRSSGGCFIATAVYGSYEADEVRVLRKFRDKYLMDTLLGKLFVEVYYAVSPYIASVLMNNKKAKSVIRNGVLNPLVRSLTNAQNDKSK